MEKAERIEKQEQVIRRALVSWLGLSGTVAGDKTVKTVMARTVAGTVIMESDDRKDVVRADGTIMEADSRRQRVFIVQAHQVVRAVLIVRHAVSLKRNPTLWSGAYSWQAIFRSLVLYSQKNKDILTDLSMSLTIELIRTFVVKVSLLIFLFTTSLVFSSSVGKFFGCVVLLSRFLFYGCPCGAGPVISAFKILIFRPFCMKVRRVMWFSFRFFCRFYCFQSESVSPSHVRSVYGMFLPRSFRLVVFMRWFCRYVGHWVSVVSSETTFPVGSSVQIEAFGVQMWSAMSSMVNIIYMWRFIIEVVCSVPCTDREIPPCCFPYDWSEKIFRSSEYGVLPFIEYVP